MTGPDEPMQFGALDPLDELGLAIDAYHQALDTPGVVTDWLLVAVVTNPTMEVDEHTKTLTTPLPQGSHVSLGLARYAEIRLEQEVRAE